MKLTLDKRIGSVHVNLEVSAGDETYVEGLDKLIYRCVEATEVLITKLNKEFFDNWISDPDNGFICDALREVGEREKR